MAGPIDWYEYFYFKTLMKDSGSATLGRSKAEAKSGAISLSLNPAIPQPILVT